MNNNHNVTELHKPGNPLNELLKQGAQQLLTQAIESPSLADAICIAAS